MSTITATLASIRAMPTARLGILMMLTGMLLFSINDAIGKWMVASYSVWQVLVLRSIGALLVLLPFLWRRGFQVLLQVDRPGAQILRVVFSTVEVICFYWAVYYLPLADVMTYWLAAPIYVAAMSPFLLGERVGPVRWTAIICGFIGVLVALEPSRASLSPAAAISIVGSLTFALMMITGRTLRGTPDITLVFWQILGGGLAGLVIAPLTWVNPAPTDLLLLGLLGVIAMLAHTCVNRALKLADANAVAPYQYTQLVWAIALGWFVFAEVPRPAMLLGSAIIVAAGLFIFFRERRVALRG
ncbi:permease [Devosia pacifica]|uniref:Permease n=1 Tax=Devosia pacifica TaxID=1335967 RepID=A0A918VYI3_9HYPH|nr:DMT family transporter [Devosia pacifica]GHA34677.1 permease [Devosia pacifica]